MTKQEIHNLVNDFLDKLVMEAECDGEPPLTKEEVDAVISLRKVMVDHFTIREITPDDTHEIQVSSYEFSDSFLRIIDKVNVSMNEIGEIVIEVIYG